MWYNDTDATGGRHPVYAIAPDSAIVSPAGGSRIDGRSVTVVGWCWGDCDIVRVDISIDGGLRWQSARVAQRVGKSWQAFKATVELDDAAIHDGDTVRLLSRATDGQGRVQPISGARNASVAVEAFVDASSPSEPS